MCDWKVPPKAKIYEALTAVADGRVKLKGGQTAEVLSSDGTKTYIVEWSSDLGGITSNDNASYWQRYIGYPIIAVLMVLGRLDFDGTVTQALSGIAWKKDESQVSERLRQGCRERPAEFGRGTWASPKGYFRGRQDIYPA